VFSLGKSSSEAQFPLEIASRQASRALISR
jgi:hypothetical protein